MTYQAYLDNIQAKTGKTPEDFKALAAKKGFMKPGVKAGEIVAWLKEDFGLGQGHAMAIVLLLRQANEPRISREEGISRLFKGDRAHWRKPYDQLARRLKKFGPDVSLAPTNTYISMLRSGRKFGVLQVTSDRLDVGIKLKGMPAGGRFEKSGNWNNMVTHRVRVDAPQQLDAEVLSWLHRAYEKA
jgi:Domain of unknown function (DUF4287)/Domain of unknown function (DUF5655)